MPLALPNPGGNPMKAPPGGPPPSGAKPVMPGNVAGGPSGPGGSPMLSAGAGAGNRQAAIHRIKMLIPELLVAQLAFDVGSKEQQAVGRAVSALNPLFGKGEPEGMLPAAMAEMRQRQMSGSPLGASPPPGLASGPTSTPGGPGESPEPITL